MKNLNELIALSKIFLQSVTDAEAIPTELLFVDIDPTPILETRTAVEDFAKENEHVHQQHENNAMQITEDVIISLNQKAQSLAVRLSHLWTDLAKQAEQDYTASQFYSADDVQSEAEDSQAEMEQLAYQLQLEHQSSSEQPAEEPITVTLPPPIAGPLRQQCEREQRQVDQAATSAVLWFIENDGRQQADTRLDEVESHDFVKPNPLPIAALSTP